MLPVLRRVGSPASWRDPFYATDDFFGVSRDLFRLTDSLLQSFPLGLGSNWTLPVRLNTGTWGVLPAEVAETEEAYRVTLEAPGFREEDLEVTVEGQMLRVRAHREYEHEEDNVRYWVRERSRGEFERVFMIPDTVDTDNIEVHYWNGILEITLPKREAARPRRLKISKPKILDRLMSGRKKESEQEATA